MSGAPQVLVLLATHNGRPWLDGQLASILGQDGVEVSVLVADDGSTDGTVELLATWAGRDRRLAVLADDPAGWPTLRSTNGVFGPGAAAARTFYRLLRAAQASGRLAPGVLVAYADQDDVWLAGKLAAQAERLAATGVDAVSGNVTAFFADGRRILIRKDYRQREFDYLLESAGPGCSFLMSSRLANRVADLVASNAPGLSVHAHDWLSYAACRAGGWRWEIEATPRVDYRQHPENSFGINRGLPAVRRRVGWMRARWHRSQATAIARLAVTLAPDPETRTALAALAGSFADTRPGARLALARRAGQLRRRPRDQWALRAFLLSGVW